MNKHTKNKKNLLFLSLLILALIIAGYFIFSYTTKSIWPFNSAETSDSATNSINYDPPTEQEVESSQEGKKNSADGAAQKENISIDISYAGGSDDAAHIDIRAFTTGVIEGSGTCTATLTLEGATVTGTSKAFIDAQSSICEPIEIPLTDFNKSGRWNLVVTYASPTHSGTSAMAEVEVSR